MLLHGSFGTRGTQPHAPLASKAPSGPRRAHTQAVFSTADSAPTPGALPWGSVPGACGPLAAPARGASIFNGTKNR